MEKVLVFLPDYGAVFGFVCFFIICKEVAHCLQSENKWDASYKSTTSIVNLYDAAAIFITWSDWIITHRQYL